VPAARRLLIVGNGPTGVADDGSFHVDLTCGHFLLELEQAGYEVTFLQGIEPLHERLNYFGCVIRDEIDVIGLDRRTVASAVTSSLAAFRALMKADFVHLFFPGRLPSRVAAICLALGKPYGLYVRGERFGTHGRDGRTIRRANFVLAASEHLAALIRPLNPKVRLIRPMCDLSAADAQVRPPPPHDSAPVRILFVGRIEADKGVPELIEAAELLRRRKMEFELNLVGLGDLHAQLERRFAGDKAIRVLGAVEDRPALMRMYEEADIFVMPSHHEGFPRVLYEAMIKSAAVVSTMVGGIPGLLQDGENCLAVPVQDPNAIALAIERLARDRQLMDAIAKAGMASALHVLENNVPHAGALRRELEPETEPA
jgi:glycosyltransferase involved in cell wall biosynthesis